MNGPYKTFCGLNKYQMFCTACAGLLILVCYRSGQPYPEFKVPATQLVQRQALPESNFALEEFFQVGPHWADNSRDTFSVHPDYIPLVSGGVVAGPYRPGNGNDSGNGTPEQASNQPKPIPASGGTRLPISTTNAPADILSLLEEATRIKVTRPEFHGSEFQLSSSIDTLILTPTSPPPPMLSESTPEQVAIADTSVAGDSYRLPFRLEGIVKATEQAPPQVILHDTQSGKRIRRFQGQAYEGVIIRKIGPGTVEVEVPTERLQMRYIDTAHRWVTM